MAFFNRRWELRAGLPGTEGRTLTDPLSISFSVEQGISRGMDRAQITLVNLGRDFAGFLAQRNMRIFLSAGYDDQFGLIFRGQVALKGVRTAVVTERGETTGQTTIESGTGEIALQETFFSQSYAPPVDNITILRAIAAALGVQLRDAALIPVIDYLTGWTFHGPASMALDELAADIGVDWSLQGDFLQLLAPDETAPEDAALVSVETGLIGRPKLVENGLEFTSYLNPALRPGRRVVVESDTPGASGTYKMSTVTHAGQYRGGAWTSAVFCRALGGV